MPMNLDYTEDELHVVGAGGEFFIVCEADQEHPPQWIAIPECGGPFKSVAEACAVKRSLVGPA